MLGRKIPNILLGKEMKKAILKTDEGLIQLHECPKCNYMVMQNDIIWKSPSEALHDSKVIKCCKFCTNDYPKMKGKTEIILELATIEQRILFTQDEKLKSLNDVYMGQRDALKWVLGMFPNKGVHIDRQPDGVLG